MTTDWLGLAREAILAVLEEEHAVTTRELEARISNQPLPSFGTTIDPDFVTAARNELYRAGILGSESERTRGGHIVTTWHRTDLRGRNTAIQRAAARKRLLAARHASWSRATKRHPRGLIGRAGEEALQNTLRGGPNVTGVRKDPDQVLGVPTSSGPVDFSAYIVAEARGRPLVHTALFEMKNQRQWFYRSNADLHRFLHKAAEVQVGAPDESVIPVMVVARRHYGTLQFGMALGIYMVQFRAQFVLDSSEVDPDQFREVYHELAYSDLRLGTKPNNQLRRAIQESLPRNMAATARRWAKVAPLTIDLHKEAMNAQQNASPELIARIEAIALEAAGPPSGYHPLPTGRT